MPHTNRNRRAGAAAIALSTLLVALALAGCGGSSKASSSSTSAARTQPAGRGQFAARASALRSCLKKNGVTLPERKPGRRGVPFGGGANGAPQPPQGVTRAQLQAAFKKCGGGFARPGRGIGAPGAKQRYTKFAACMRKNGVSLPTPNTSGKGPIFDTKGIDTASAAFKSAAAKCVRELPPHGPPAGQ
jgi:hypothetical protein